MNNYDNLNFSKLKTCNQLWNDMIPTEGGRICMKCSRTIVDFTKKTNADIAKIHLSHRNGVCGYYKPEQLVPKAQKSEHSRYKNFKSIVLAGISYFAVTQIVEAKEKNRTGRECEQTNKIKRENNTTERLEESKDHLVNADTIRISGTVRNRSDGAVIPGVVIMIDGTTIGTTSNDDGNFILWAEDLSDSISTIKIIAHFIGYMRVEKEVSVKETSAIEILMDGDYAQMTDFIVIKMPWYSRVWWSIKKPFRRRS